MWKSQARTEIAFLRDVRTGKTASRFVHFTGIWQIAAAFCTS